MTNHLIANKLIYLLYQIFLYYQHSYYSSIDYLSNNIKNFNFKKNYLKTSYETLLTPSTDKSEEIYQSI